MSGALKAKIIVVVVLLALTAALVGTCIAYRNRACEHTSLEHIEAVEPTCTESGNIEHWACKRCGATFKDESGAEEIGRVVRTALGHDLTRHSAVEPTCTEAGNVEYWECERCGVIFSDSAATKPLDDHIVAASGHDWNEPVWDWSDDYSKATAYFVCNKDSEHVESVTAKVTISSASATCTGSGRITYLAKAELDGKTYSDSEVVQSGALGHDWTVSEWIWSNDHTSVTAKFVCSRDPSHTREVTETEIVINEDPATCLADGKTEYSVEIAFDGNTYSDTAVVTLPATGHNWSAPEWTWNGDYSEATATFTCLNDPSHTETVNAVVSILSSSATCTEPGNTEYKAELSFNGNVYADSRSVSGEALGHNWTVSEWIWSEDYTSVRAKFVCARDNSHTHELTETEIVVNEDPATCEKEGKTEYSVEIAFDGNTYSDTAVVTLPATGHNWSAPEWTWSEDSSEATATFTCLNDPSHTETLAAEVTLVDTTATCTAPGETGFMAKVTFNGKDHTDKQTVINEALGHDWTVSEWIWFKDYTSVTAYFVCSRDPSHTDSVTATDIDINEVTATCEKEGKTEYSIEIVFDGNTYSDTAVVTIPATGHNWSAPEWTWSDDSSEAAATFTCQNDPSHTETLAAEVTIVDTTVATCTAPGETGFMAKVTFNGKDHTDKQTVINEALGHDWTVSEWIWSKDHTSVTAKFVCSRDPSHTDSVTATDIDINEVSATCEKDGKTEYSVEIVFDGNTYSDTAVVTIPATGHNWGDPEWTWSEDSSEAEATFTCLNDPSHTETLAAEVKKVDTTATCTAPGETGFMAKVTFNGKDHTDKQTVINGALGHDWTVSEWIWSEDYTSVTAKFVCSRDNSHTREISGQINEDVIKPVSCTEDGESTFTATVSLDGEIYTDQKASVVIKAEGHVFSENWSADDVYHWHECTVCGEKRDLSTHELVDFICSVCNHTIIYTAGLEYTLSDDGASYLVSGIGTATDRDIKIMPRYDGKPVTGIADNAFKSNTEIDSVLIPDGVESIGANAFYGCRYLTKVVIPDSVKSIGSSAFYNCRSITRIDYSGDISGWLNIEGLDDLMYYASSSCELYIGGTKVEGELIIPEGVTSIPSYAFRNLKGITSVTIPDSVTSIRTYAFSGCSGITRVDYSGNISGWLNIRWLDDLMDYVSSSCELHIDRAKVEGDIIIPEGVTSIPSSAFRYQTGITSVTIPDSVTSIGWYAFENCSSLTEVTIPDSVTSIGDYAFQNCSSLTSVTIGNGVTSIGDRAFYGCSGLTSVTIPDSVTSIGNGAFQGCINVIETDNGVSYVDKWVVDCDDSVTAANIRSDTVGIADHAFSGCKTLKSVIIPDTVTSIGDRAFSGCSGMTEVTIPESVTSIGDYAFSGCTALSTLNWNAVNVSGFDNDVFNNAGTDGYGISVTFGDSVESIPSYLFYSNSSSYITPKITKITIGDNVKSIGSNAFRGVSSVSSVIIPASVESIGDYAFYYIDTVYCEAQSKPSNWNSWVHRDSNVIWGYNNNTYSAEFDYVARNNKAYLTKYKGSGAEVTIPDTLNGYKVVSFGEIFKNNTNITKVVIGNNVTSVFPYAFYGCSRLTSVTIPDSVTSIGEYAFYDCSGLTEVTIGNGVTSIGERAFYYCRSITEIAYSGDNSGWLNIEGLDNLMEYVSSSLELHIGGKKVEGDIIIPEGVTSIPGSAFIYQTGITSVTIPDSVTSIGDYAFDGCSGLTEVTIGNGVTSIGWYAFRNCSSITRIYYSGDITGWLNISGLDYLMSDVSSSCELHIDRAKVEGDIIIPEGVTSIAGSAFRNLQGITSVTIPDSVTSIGYSAFYGCSGLTSVTIPDSVTSIGEDAFEGCINLIQKVDGVSYVDKWVVDCDSSVTAANIRSDTVGIADSAFYDCTTLKSVTIPDSVTSIGRYAFRNCSSLTSVTIGNGVTSIGSSAFKNCSSLTEVTIPDSVTSIEMGVFYGCSSLTSVTIPDSVTSIGGDAFSGCSSLTSVTIPDSVTSIGVYAFHDCSGLQSVTIGNGVTSIGRYAFLSCSGLDSATFKNTSGWSAGSTSLSSGKLADENTAAQYLRSTYVSDKWSKN